MRACAGCKRRDETEEFIRFVEFEGELLPDLTRKLPGRGYNVCPTYKCIKDFIKRKFRGRKNPDEIYERTVKALKDYILHLISLSHKTGITVIGQDEIKKLRSCEGTLILAEDLSPKTKERLKREEWLTLEDVFNSEEIGNALRRERRAGALFVERVGLGRKLYENVRKLKSLLSK